MEEKDIKAPLYYVMGRKMNEAALEAAHAALLLTPCFTGIVNKDTDCTLLRPFVEQLLQAADESACKELSAHVARASRGPVLTVDNGDVLMAVYSDGEEEILC